MKEFYTFKLKTQAADIAMSNAMDVVPDTYFEVDSDFDTTNKLKEVTVHAWLTTKQVNKVINELYTHNGITVMQKINYRNTLFVSFNKKC